MPFGDGTGPGPRGFGGGFGGFGNGFGRGRRGRGCRTVAPCAALNASERKIFLEERKKAIEEELSELGKKMEDKSE